MLETKYEVLTRMDAAILFFEDSARNLRELKQQWLEAHDEQRDEPPTPTTAYKKPITPRQMMIIDAVVEFEKWSEWSGTKITFDAVIEAVWQQYPRGESVRDQRKTNAGRDLRHVIAAGHLVENDAGVVSLPDAGGV